VFLCAEYGTDESPFGVDVAHSVPTRSLGQPAVGDSGQQVRSVRISSARLLLWGAVHNVYNHSAIMQPQSWELLRTSVVE